MSFIYEIIQFKNKKIKFLSYEVQKEICGVTERRCLTRAI